MDSEKMAQAMKLMQFMQNNDKILDQDGKLAGNMEALQQAMTGNITKDIFDKYSMPGTLSGDAYGRRLPRAQVLKMFLKQKKDMGDMYSQANTVLTDTAIFFPTQAKKRSVPEDARFTQTLLPVCFRDLTPANTHRGQVLTVRVLGCCQP
jgi:hypothetical protein